MQHAAALPIDGEGQDTVLSGIGTFLGVARRALAKTRETGQPTVLEASVEEMEKMLGACEEYLLANLTSSDPHAAPAALLAAAPTLLRPVAQDAC